LWLSHRKDNLYTPETAKEAAQWEISHFMNGTKRDNATKRDRSDNRGVKETREWNWDRACKKLEFEGGRRGVANK
jgi:hypothetical protein